MSLLSPPGVLSLQLMSTNSPEELQRTLVQWAADISRWSRLVTQFANSGSTLNRPLYEVMVGTTYFDTSLGIPIWLAQLVPPVWVDATGAPV